MHKYAKVKTLPSKRQVLSKLKRYARNKKLLTLLVRALRANARLKKKIAKSRQHKDPIVSTKLSRRIDNKKFKYLNLIRKLRRGQDISELKDFVRLKKRYWRKSENKKLKQHFGKLLMTMLGRKKTFVRSNDKKK